MHKSTAKAEFYFFGSALAAIFLMICISLLSVLRQTFPVPARFPWKPAQNRGQEGITEERYKQFLILYLKEILYKNAMTGSSIS